MNTLKLVKELCKIEAEKNPVGKDLFQAGKQLAYSHIYFELNRNNIEREESVIFRLLIISAAINGILIATILAIKYL